MALEVPPSIRQDYPGVADPGAEGPPTLWQNISGFAGQIQGFFQGGMGVGGMPGQMPDPESVVPKYLRRLEAAGVAVGIVAAVYEAYVHFRGTGANHKQAKRMALLANGIRHRRRRMRPTNLHALRRAVRRLRGFRRAASKVHGVLGGRSRGGGYAPHRRRRRVYRRGDLSPYMVEDYEDVEDMADELEDDGYDPERFQEAE